jgi:hypothetical protein
MSEQRRSAAPGLAPPPRLRERPRIGLTVELRTTPVGEVRHPPLADAHISVHAGAPVRVACPTSRARSLRTHGDINLLPAGMSDVWVDDDAGRSVDLRLPTALLRLAAEEMGLDPDRAGIEPRHHFKDAQIEHIAWALEAECRADFPNGMLYSESLGMALAVHLLEGAALARRSPRDPGRAGGGVLAPEPHGALHASRPRGDPDRRHALARVKPSRAARSAAGNPEQDRADRDQHGAGDLAPRGPLADRPGQRLREHDRGVPQRQDGARAARA